MLVLQQMTFKIQDYFIISSEKLNTWLNIYHITVDSNTLQILKLKEQLLKIYVIWKNTYYAVL